MIYEPVTEIGKAIAGALRFDDQVRLDIHDILEKWETSLKHIDARPHHYNPEEAIRIAESAYPLLFSGRYVISNMKQMHEKAQKFGLVQTKLLEWDNIYQRSPKAAMTILEDIFKIYLRGGDG